MNGSLSIRRKSCRRRSMDSAAKRTDNTILLRIILFACIAAVFIYPSSSIVLGTVVAALLVFLYFARNDTVLVTVFIVVANDALGTMILGKVSFQYLLILFVLYELFAQKQIRVRIFAAVFLLLAIAAQPLVTGIIGTKALIFTSLYIVSLALQFEKYKDDRELFISKFTEAFSIIVFLIALHAAITGGVVYKEVQNTQYHYEYQRTGVLGVGIGDPNFSSLLLCTGIACTVINKSFKLLLKLMFIAVMIFAMFGTASTSGFLALILISLLIVSINENATKTVKRILFIVLGFVVIYNIYILLPENYHISDLDFYIERFTSKIEALFVGNYHDVTSGRSDISDQYFNYINNEQSVWRMFLGGNSIMAEFDMAPHNTYIDFILQFGYVGLAVIVATVIHRVYKVYKTYEFANYRKLSIVLKFLYAFFAFTLSVYTGSTFAVMMFVFFIL